MGAVFASIRPAATLVEVSALMDPSLLIEIEADARPRLIGGQTGSAARSRAARATATSTTAAESPMQQVPPPGGQGPQTTTASHSIPTWKRGVPAVVRR